MPIDAGNLNPLQILARESSTLRVRLFQAPLPLRPPPTLSATVECDFPGYVPLEHAPWVMQPIPAERQVIELAVECMFRRDGTLRPQFVYGAHVTVLATDLGEQFLSFAILKTPQRMALAGQRLWLRLDLLATPIPDGAALTWYVFGKAAAVSTVAINE